ncbi:MAG: hypothetical protein V9E82_01925 [Candidatus Nanopelagicales bacterium]
MAQIAGLIDAPGANQAFQNRERGGVGIASRRVVPVCARMLLRETHPSTHGGCVALLQGRPSGGHRQPSIFSDLSFAESGEPDAQTVKRAGRHTCRNGRPDDSGHKSGVAGCRRMPDRRFHVPARVEPHRGAFVQPGDLTGCRSLQFGEQLLYQQVVAAVARRLAVDSDEQLNAAVEVRKNQCGILPLQ